MAQTPSRKGGWGKEVSGVLGQRHAWRLWNWSSLSCVLCSFAMREPSEAVQVASKRFTLQAFVVRSA